MIHAGLGLRDGGPEARALLRGDGGLLPTSVGRLQRPKPQQYDLGLRAERVLLPQPDRGHRGADGVQTPRVQLPKFVEHGLGHRETSLEGPEVKHPAEKAVYHRALTLIVQEAHRRLDEMEAQNLVSLGYAIVISNFEAPDFLFRALPERLAKVCGRANAQDLSNAVWATAKVGGGNSDQTGARTFFIVEEEVLRRGAARLENPQNISNTAWAFAKAGQGSDGLWALLADAATRRMSQFKAQNCSNTLYAFAVAQRKDHHALFEAVSREILQRAETDLGSQDLANMSWALATLGFVMPEDDGGRGTLQKRGGVTNNVTTAPWLGPTLDALSRGAQRSCRKFNPQHLANTAWRASRV